MLTKRILRAVVVLGVLATAAACAGSGPGFVAPEDPDGDPIELFEEIPSEAPDSL